MPARSAQLLCTALALGAIACEPDLMLGGALHFEEIDAADATRRAATEPIHLVQVREPDAEEPRIAGASIQAPEQALPDPAETVDRPIFVIGRDDRVVRRFAARLVRAGFARVVAVRGGIDPWRQRRLPALESAP